MFYWGFQFFILFFFRLFVCVLLGLQLFFFPQKRTPFNASWGFRLCRTVNNIFLLFSFLFELVCGGVLILKSLSYPDRFLVGGSTQEEDLKEALVTIYIIESQSCFCCLFFKSPPVNVFNTSFKPIIGCA